MKRSSLANKVESAPTLVSVLPLAEVTKQTDSLTHRQSEAEYPYRTASGIPIRFRLNDSHLLNESRSVASRDQLKLHLRLADLQLLRGFDQLLCLEGLQGVEHLPHQIETVRKVLRRFRGRVLLADEVGLGKTIEACLLLREYLLRGQVRRVLIMVPNPLVSQWHEELATKFLLDFTVPPRTVASDRLEFWEQTDRVLVSTSFAKSGKRPEAITNAAWDLVIVDEAHHCKNRSTRIWQLVNSLKRKHIFLLSATPVQNNLTELHSLLTLLEPGHLKTEADFKRQYVTRGNPRDPRNREKLRSLLSEVMIRNTRSLVQINLPPRYAQTIMARPEGSERELYQEVDGFLRMLTAKSDADADESIGDTPISEGSTEVTAASAPVGRVSRMKLQSLLQTLGSHPSAFASGIESLAEVDQVAQRLKVLATSVTKSAKDVRLLELLQQSKGHKALVFVHSKKTLHRLQELMTETKISFSTFSGEQSASEKDLAVESLRNSVNVMLCTESGGEGRNLQFADTLINYDLPWNPMRIEQRIGRIHRFGQTQDVFIFNLCTEGSIESRILRLLNDKIRMFELVVGEVGSILGNLDEGEEFESLVLKMWVNSASDAQLEKSFDQLGDSLLDAQEKYLDAKNLDDALFGEDYE